MKASRVKRINEHLATAERLVKEAADECRKGLAAIRQYENIEQQLDFDPEVK